MVDKCKGRRWAAITADMRDHQIVGMSVPPPKAADTERHAQSPYVAWSDLIMSAAWEPHRIRMNGEVIPLQRGEFLAGRSYWAKRWNWGEQAVRGFFTRLARAKMIVFCNQRSNQGVTVAKLSNFEAFQSRGGSKQPSQQPRSNQGPTNEQPYNTRDTIVTKKEEGSHNAFAAAQERAVLDQAIADFNVAAQALGFAKLTTLSEARSKALTKRLADLGSGDVAAGGVRFRAALSAIPHDAFLSGRKKPRQGQEPFRLNFERLLQTNGPMGDVLARLCDAHDEHGPATANTGSKAPTGADAFATDWAAAMAEEREAQKARFSGVTSPETQILPLERHEAVAATSLSPDLEMRASDQRRRIGDGSTRWGRPPNGIHH